MKATNLTMAWILIFLGILFMAVGCAGGYKLLGYNTEQAEILAAKDRGEIFKMVEDSRSYFWETVSVVLAGVGTTVSGLLSRWLLGERKMTKAMITGIENSSENNVKKSVQQNAIVLGVEKKLNKRVEALT